MITNNTTFVFTGPESSAKSSLSKLFSKEFNLPLVQEFAREYLESLGRDYTLEDVLIMSKGQKEKEEAYSNQSSVLDTDLTVFSVWLEVKYGYKEKWIEGHLKDNHNKVYLLCYPDLEWEEDPLRETNSKEERESLFNRYERLLIDKKAKYFIIKGQGQERIENARRVFETQNL